MARRLNVGIVRLRSQALDLGELDDSGTPGADGLTLQLDALTLFLGGFAAGGVGLDSVQDCGKRNVRFLCWGRIQVCSLWGGGCFWGGISHSAYIHLLIGSG